MFFFSLPSPYFVIQGQIGGPKITLTGARFWGTRFLRFPTLYEKIWEMLNHMEKYMDIVETHRTSVCNHCKKLDG